MRLKAPGNPCNSFAGDRLRAASCVLSCANKDRIKAANESKTKPAQHPELPGRARLRRGGDSCGRRAGVAGRSGGGQPHRRARATSASTPRRSAPTCSIQPGAEFLRRRRGRIAEGAVRDRALRRRADRCSAAATLVVIVVENPIINEVAFEGNKKFKDDQLASVVAVGSRAASSRAPRCRATSAKILELYRRSGRFQASVTPQIDRAAEQPREPRLRRSPKGRRPASPASPSSATRPSATRGCATSSRRAAAAS